MTRPASSTTGKALILRARSIAAISLKDASFLTATTDVVMTSLTVALMVTTSRRGLQPSALRRRTETGTAEGHQPRIAADRSAIRDYAARGSGPSPKYPRHAARNAGRGHRPEVKDHETDYRDRQAGQAR